MNRLRSPILLSVGLIFCMAALASPNVWDKAVGAQGKAQHISVYRSPTCGCCKGWIAHLRKHNFKVEDIQVEDIGAIKERYGIPTNMASCHTAKIGGYLIEGHVPAGDIKRLLSERPPLKGLAVPRMPVGSPGMEMGDRKDAFAVVGFKRDGTFQVYKEYWDY